MPQLLIATNNPGKLAEVRRLPSRDQMVAAMGRGAAAVLGRRLQAGELHGVLALGGNQGAAMAAIAMRDLPFGLPKAIITTMASGNVRPYVGCKDILTLFTVADLVGGPNRVTAPVLRNAALAVAGMARGARSRPAEPSTSGRNLVASTGFGITSGLNRQIARDVAAYVDQALKKVLSQGPIVETHKAAILAALDITNELFQTKKGEREVAARLAALADDLTKLLPPGKRKTLSHSLTAES